MTASVARLALAMATISLKLSIWGSLRNCGAPPDSEMAVATSVASSALVAPPRGSRPAIRAARARAAGVAIAWKMIRRDDGGEANWARLNARLTPDWFRSMQERQAVPKTQAARYSVGGSRNRNTMPGSSLSENAWRSRRKWTSTTLVSPR